MEEPYILKSFFDPEGKPFKIISCDGSAGIPKKFASDVILILRNYKSSIISGRTEPLKGKTVILLPSLRGQHLILPLEEISSFANMLLALDEKLATASN
jgi:hypothetical protein